MPTQICACGRQFKNRRAWSKHATHYAADARCRDYYETRQKQRDIAREKRRGALEPSDVSPSSRAANLDDPLKILEILKDAIIRKPVDPDILSQALKQTLSKYEAQNRLFLIAAANNQLPRIVRLLSFIERTETVLFSEERIKDATTKELTRLYALAQSNLLDGMETVKKVADMRLEMQQGQSADGLEAIFDYSESDELNALSNLPGLDAPGRDRVRKIVAGLLEGIEKESLPADTADLDEDLEEDEFGSEEEEEEEAEDAEIE